MWETDGHRLDELGVCGRGAQETAVQTGSKGPGGVWLPMESRSVCENHPEPLWGPGDQRPGLRSWLIDSFCVARALKLVVLGPFPTRQVYGLPGSVMELQG